MSSRIKAIIKPDLLTWARESSGLTIEEAAKKAQLNVDFLTSCEQGSEQLSVSQLRKLAQVYKRPIAVFYLSKPPKKFDALRDFRRLPGESEISESPKLRLEIRRAIYRRKVALDMYHDLGTNPPRFMPSTGLLEDQEQVAKKIRRLLSLSQDQQVSFKSNYNALNRWRAAIESVGVFVFQATGIELNEMRGFSISDTPLPVIVVNIKDSPMGRVFSMLHEFAHLMLREGGVCDLEDRKHPAAEQKIESFCNHVAGATLVPRNWLFNEIEQLDKRYKDNWPDEVIHLLAHKFHASREVILRRLLINNLTTEDFYRRKRQEFQRQYALLQKKESGFTSPDVKAISVAGRSFVQLVLNSYYQEKITSSDVSDFLEVRLKHMPKIEKAIQNRTVEFGVGL